MSEDNGNGKDNGNGSAEFDEKEFVERSMQVCKDTYRDGAEKLKDLAQKRDALVSSLADVVKQMELIAAEMNQTQGKFDVFGTITFVDPPEDADADATPS